MDFRFGTDGIRGHADQFPFTADGLQHLGGAIAQWSENCLGTKSPQILMISDTRESCPRIKENLITALRGSVIDAGVMPSPAALWFLKSMPNLDFAIVISASHNPYHDNGIKIFKRDGKLSADDELYIQNIMNNGSIPTISGTSAQLLLTLSWQRYAQELSRFFPVQFLKGKKIILDCANGATSLAAPAIFTSFGAQVMAIHNSPNGININAACGSTHPESLAKQVVQAKADIGFAFDGDGDRVIAINSAGLLRDGDDILALLSQDPSFAASPAVVGTIVSNSGLEQYLARSGKKLIRTPVGDRHVGLALAAHNLQLGAEPSGHVIIRPLLESGDGILVALRLCRTLNTTNNWAMNSFERYQQQTFNIAAHQKPSLDAAPIAPIIAAHQERLPTGRIIVRYSGTEPLLRIMVEAPTATEVTAIGQSLVHELQNIVNSNNRIH